MLILDQLKKGDRPLRLVALGILLGLGLLLTGLFYVQVVCGKRYQASQVSQSFRTIRLPAVRGRILDTHGVALADNRPCYTVNLYLEELRSHFQSAYSERVAELNPPRPERAELGRQVRYEVASNFIGRASAALRRPTVIEPRSFQEHYSERLALPMPIFQDLSLEEASRFVEQVSTLPGLELEAQPLRSYPFRTVAAHVLGYLRRNDRPQEEDLFTRYSLPDFSGAAGIERVFDRSLRGRPGVKSVLVNNLGYRQSESTWNDAEPGETVVLTLDIGLQQVAETALQSAGPGTRGAAVVLDVTSGDILVLASAPSFDPNRFLPRLRPEHWQTYQDPQLLPLFNRASAGAYPPGSIFKILVSLAALEAGILDPDKLYHSPGYYLLGRGPRARKIKDEALGGQPGSFDLRRALKLSSNAYFIHYGLLTGIDDLARLGQKFHLGEKTDIPVSQESTGVFPTAEWRNHERDGRWFEGDTANLSIGQGFITITPVQMAALTAAVANGGTVLWPRLVARIEPADPLRAPEAFTFPAARIRDRLGVSRRNLRLVHEAMLADVEDADGTGHKAYVKGLSICAKTGTAQVPRKQRMDHITWFTSFAPFEKPRYAVVVVVESGVSGGTTCAPIARQIYLALQQRLLNSSEPSTDHLVQTDR